MMKHAERIVSKYLRLLTLPSFILRSHQAWHDQPCGTHRLRRCPIVASSNNILPARESSYSLPKLRASLHSSFSRASMRSCNATMRHWQSSFSSASMRHCKASMRLSACCNFTGSSPGGIGVFVETGVHRGGLLWLLLALAMDGDSSRVTFRPSGPSDFTMIFPKTSVQLRCLSFWKWCVLLMDFSTQS